MILRCIFLLGVVLLCGCSRTTAPQPQQEVHPTIVSLNPCTDAILAEVAAPGQLLAISHYSHDPGASSMLAQDAARFAATGGTAEEVLALAPQVVVAGAFLSPDLNDALVAGGVQVETFGIAASLAESTAQVRALAALAGQAERGEVLVARIEAAWAHGAHSDKPIETLLWQQGGIVPGEGTLAAAMLEQSGFALHSAASGMGQGEYLPLEQVLAEPPALVLAAGDDPMLRHPVLRKVKRVEYHAFDPALLYCGGPTIIRAMARLAEIRGKTG